MPQDAPGPKPAASFAEFYCVKSFPASSDSTHPIDGFGKLRPTSERLLSKADVASKKLCAWHRVTSLG